MSTDARESLLRAAQQLYAANGVAATTPRQVIERSGVGHGSLYHHFPSKRDLALAAVGRSVDEALASSSDALNAHTESRARIAAYLERPREATSGCRIGRLTADPFVAADEDLSASVARYFLDLIGLVADVFEEQGLDGGVARDRATAAVAVIQGGYVLSRATGDEEMMRAAVRGFLGLVDAPQRPEGDS
ncbi:TetR/AcrR family transcriptional regulator [Microbacterium sufflavum]|uniref:TetR/AcrR family transcriptional regulator n=1 Tax=Microbacterium sufflavum TaxID=2851649 RepID=A0ABY4IEB2_9MICO|nr:TetR/AcrR family transcriptional regulator [Microbacterium sufflavum]